MSIGTSVVCAWSLLRSRGLVAQTLRGDRWVVVVVVVMVGGGSWWAERGALVWVVGPSHIVCACCNARPEKRRASAVAWGWTQPDVRTQHAVLGGKSFPKPTHNAGLKLIACQCWRVCGRALRVITRVLECLKPLLQRNFLYLHVGTDRTP